MNAKQSYNAKQTTTHVAASTSAVSLIKNLTTVSFPPDKVAWMGNILSRMELKRKADKDEV